MRECDHTFLVFHVFTFIQLNLLNLLFWYTLQVKMFIQIA